MGGEFTFELLADGAVASERLAVGCVSGHRGDKVRILDAEIKICYEGLSGGVGGHGHKERQFPDLGCFLVEHGDHAVESGYNRHDLYVLAVKYLVETGEQCLPAFPIIFGEKGECLVVQRHTARDGSIYIAVPADSLAGAVFEKTVTDIVGGQTVEVADTASDERLEDEHVAVTLQTRENAQVEGQQAITLFEGEIDRCAVYLVADSETFPTLVCGDTLFERPVQKGADMAEHTFDKGAEP